MNQSYFNLSILDFSKTQNKHKPRNKITASWKSFKSMAGWQGFKIQWGIHWNISELMNQSNQPPLVAYVMEHSTQRNSMIEFDFLQQ